MNYTCSINGYTGGVSALPNQPSCVQDNSETTLFLTQDILEIDAGKQLIATKTLLVKEECAWLLINRHHVVLLLAVKLDSIAELPEPVFV
jgi:hypothetical protein